MCDMCVVSDGKVYLCDERCQINKQQNIPKTTPYTIRTTHERPQRQNPRIIMLNSFACLARGNNENNPPNTEGVLAFVAKPLSTKRQAILSKTKQEKNAASFELAKEADEQLSKLLTGANTLLQVWSTCSPLLP